MRGWIIIEMILMMWLKQGNEDKKWFALILVDITNRGIYNCINPVSG
jgi:hypothetical protein